MSVSFSAPSSVRMPDFKNAFTSSRTRLSPTRARTLVLEERSVKSRRSRPGCRPRRSTHKRWDLARCRRLGHRVMNPVSGAEPVGAREEIRLEDRLQHQLQGRLDHPVADRADPQAAALGRTRFRDQPLPRRQRAETAVLQTAPQRAEELLRRPAPGRMRPCGRPPRRSSRPLLPPHPSPADQGGRRDRRRAVNRSSNRQ